MTLPDPHASRSHYSPDRRTALVLTGTGIDGAYHAGALHALAEAGVRLDIVAGRGIGAVGALFAAIDGGARLWEKGGLWRRPLQQSLYPWRPAYRHVATGLAIAALLLVVPAVVLGLSLAAYQIALLSPRSPAPGTAAVARRRLGASARRHARARRAADAAAATRERRARRRGGGGARCSRARTARAAGAARPARGALVDAARDAVFRRGDGRLLHRWTLGSVAGRCERRPARAYRSEPPLRGTARRQPRASRDSASCCSSRTTSTHDTTSCSRCSAAGHAGRSSCGDRRRRRTGDRRRRSIWRAPRATSCSTPSPARCRFRRPPTLRSSASRPRATGAARRIGSPTGRAACCACSRRPRRPARDR